MAEYPHGEKVGRMLSVGATVELAQPGRRAVVRRFIGEGGQGTVFEVAIHPGGERMALKWYFPASGTDVQRAAISDLIDRGSPNERFLWPSEIAWIPHVGSFGYLMPLRPPAWAGLADLLSAKVDLSFSRVCTLGMELADSFLALHNEGLCYRDISFGNIFFDPDSGRPLICDNDNVGIDGASYSAVLGTRRFMAPEIVRGQAMPSTNTDLWSLAVLLFYLLMVGHPLLGRRELDFPTWDARAEEELFGHRPRFVFDPADGSNAPLPELHGSVLRNWQTYPDQIRALFTRAFTVGVLDVREGRVRESVWRAALAQLRDAIMCCPGCGKESFWDNQHPDRPVVCWSCGQDIDRPVRLEIEGRVLVLNQGTRISHHHLRRDYDFSGTVASVQPHPTRAERWGLRNDTTDAWQVLAPNGMRSAVEPGRSVGLLPGTRVQIGGVRTRIVR